MKKLFKLILFSLLSFQTTNLHAALVNGLALTIDLPSEFYGYTAVHQTTSPTNVLFSTGNTAAIDFSG